MNVSVSIAPEGLKFGRIFLEAFLILLQLLVILIGQLDVQAKMQEKLQHWKKLLKTIEKAFNLI